MFDSHGHALLRSPLRRRNERRVLPGSPWQSSKEQFVIVTVKKRKRH